MVQSILEFDARKITPEARQRVRQLLQQKANSFRPEIIRRASVAAEPLAVHRPPPVRRRVEGGWRLYKLLLSKALEYFLGFFIYKKSEIFLPRGPDPWFKVQRGPGAVGAGQHGVQRRAHQDAAPRGAAGGPRGPPAGASGGTPFDAKDWVWHPFAAFRQ